jgi:16S rRNA G966 N2-methylase RsmD
VTYPVHPAATLFPMMDAEALAALADDIREHGQRELVILFDDKVLDGRNRLLACELAGVEPRFVTRTDAEVGDPIAFVLSLNKHRRHLEPAQLATLGVKVSAAYAVAAAERARVAGEIGRETRWAGNGPLPAHAAPERDNDARSLVQAAKQVGAGINATATMAAVLRDAPEVFAAVESGAIARVTDAKRIAAMPAEQRAEVLQRVEAGEEPRRAVVSTQRASIVSAAEGTPRDSAQYALHTCDLEAAPIDDASVDVIITDPPYPHEFLPCYEALGRLACRVLKPGASCLVMIGQSYLPDVVAALIRGGLRYHWTLAYLTPGGQAVQVFPRKVNTFWKPLLWFTNGAREHGGWIGDVTKSVVNDNDKHAHDWGQSVSGMADIVSRLSAPSNTVLDPFCGAGTTGVAALSLGRKFIGVDIDAAHIATSAARLAAVTP